MTRHLLALSSRRASPLAWAAWLVAGCGQELPDSDAAHYLGDPGLAHYSPLAQIDRNNVGALEPAWVYDGNEFGDGVSTLLTSPLVIDGVLYGLTPRLNAFALDAATGAELWRFETEATSGVQRGLAWWDGGDGARLFFGAGPHLIALDPDTGQPAATFADGGRLDLRGFGEGVEVTAPSPAVVFEDLVIVGLEFDDAVQGPSVVAVDARSSRLAWEFRAGTSAGVGMALDAARELLFVPTGPPIPQHVGRDRAGDGVLSDALLALDARTGKLRWHRQIVHNGLRGRELTAPPTLVQAQRAGTFVDAVALPTRPGDLFVFDRETGASLFETKEVQAPSSLIPGEDAVPVHTVSALSLTRTSPTEIAGLPHEPFAPPSLAGTLLFPGFGGGVGWGGAAYDPTGRKLLVNVQETASLLRLIEIPAGFSAQDAYLAHCARCHGVDRKGLHVGRQDRYGAGGPSLVGIGERLTDRQIDASIVRGRGAMQPLPEVGELHRMAIIEYLVSEPDYLTYDERTTATTYAAVEPATIQDAEGLPANAPPWGSLLAVNLDTGDIDWRVPLGDQPGQAGSGLGAENAGGPLLTASGLLFVAATPDAKLRAFDAADGTLLWQGDLDAAGHATPITYSTGGRQYVVVSTGGGLLGPPSGATYAAFRLPR